MSLLFVPAAVLGSGAFAASTRLKHAAARPDRGPARASRASWLRDPRYLQGIGLDAIGLGLQVLALRLGPLAGVQPLMICSLVFALAFESGRRRGRQLRWALAIVGGLTAFTLLADTRTAPAIAADRGPAIVLSVAAVLGASLLLAAASRLAPRVRVLLLAVVAGSAYAVSAALIKCLTALAALGIAAVLGGWQLYALILVGAAGLVLTQAAFASGPLTASLPTMAIVDPVASVVIGVAVFDERIRSSPVVLGALALIGAVLAVAVARLSPGRRDAPSTGATRRSLATSS